MAKKQKYRLEPLLKIRERRLRETEIALAKTIRKLNEEKEKLESIEKLKEDVRLEKNGYRKKLSNKMATGQSRVFDSQMHENYLRKLTEDEENLDREIEEQKEEVKLAQEKLKRARRDYIDAASDLDIMKKHKDLWEKKLVRTLSAAENKLMNEIGNTVVQINKMRGG